ncbi:MAG: tRNA guanosine(34) transglycosylase Tgt [Candidatus Kuenenbacteria bacterium]
MFKLHQKSKKSQARLGVFKTRHGKIDTPFFLPVATRGAIKGLSVADIKALGAQVILSNTYHLWLKPGREVIRRAGGLHKFMGWSGPILTDSGGFQVFSLSKVRKVKNDGVEFCVPKSGDKYFLTPKLALEIQAELGSDIVMVLDECVGYPCSRQAAVEATDRTTLWARQAIKYWPKIKKSSQALFGIVQGSVFKDLRQQSCSELRQLPFDGYAIGGLAVGEEAKQMYQVLDYTVPLLPQDKLHYLMGVGYPENIVEAVKRGVDCFDCVIPTREARHGRIYLWKKSGQQDKVKLLTSGEKFYEVINIKSAVYKKDFSLLGPGCTCTSCAQLKTTRAYLRHLFDIQETLALRLGTIHNLHFYLELMKIIRRAIKPGVL